MIADADNPFNEKAEEVQLAKTVEVQDYKVSINVLGLRELTPDGLMPI